MPEVVVRETPRPQQRHRTAGGHEYTPTATLEAQRRIRCAWEEKGLPCLRGPLSLTVWAYLPRPRGHFGTGRNAGRLRPSAPEYPGGRSADWDNLGKLVSDALIGMAYPDDGEIIDAIVHKRYGENGAGYWRIIVEYAA